MAAASFGWTLLLDRTLEFAFILGCYLAVNICYDFFLKKMVVADVITIAIGFLIRVKAGGAAIDEPISQWLILCTFFTASFLACCKRRSELALAEDAPEAREVLADYSFSILDVLIGVTASLSIMTYALYTVSEHTVEAFGTVGIIYTLPTVLYGIGRYIFLVYSRREGEDPAAVILTDRGIIAAVVLWLAIALFAVYGGMGSVIGK
jgi:4-hydroxybenzoate polyprenyltransferase